MKINGAWYINELPDHVVVEIENGSLEKFYLTPFRKISEADLTPYNGYHPTKLVSQKLPNYLYRHYGLEIAGDIRTKSIITAAKVTTEYNPFVETLSNDDKDITLVVQVDYMPGIGVPSPSTWYSYDGGTENDREYLEKLADEIIGKTWDNPSMHVVHTGPIWLK